MLNLSILLPYSLQKIRVKHFILRPGVKRYSLSNTISMNLARTFVTLFFCLSISALYSQKEAAQRKGMFSFSISLSDYNFVSQKERVQIGQYQLWHPGQLLETSYSPYRSFGQPGRGFFQFSCIIRKRG